MSTNHRLSSLACQLLPDQKFLIDGELQICEFILLAWQEWIYKCARTHTRSHFHCMKAWIWHAVSISAIDEFEWLFIHWLPSVDGMVWPKEYCIWLSGSVQRLHISQWVCAVCEIYHFAASCIFLLWSFSPCDKWASSSRNHHVWLYCFG
jgi:hypothetical protein